MGKGTLYPLQVERKNFDTVKAYQDIRDWTMRLCGPLEIDDYNLSTMADVSPIKWHIAHVSWFFETFLLKAFKQDYEEFHPRFAYLFNSYYETVGTFHPRAERANLNRPTLKQVLDYRQHVDREMVELIRFADGATLSKLAPLILVGLHHEQQHQELMMTDIKHVFASNPLRPAYHPTEWPAPALTSAMEWYSFKGGVVQIGHEPAQIGFAYDNETPRHNTYIEPYRLASRPVNNAEYRNFIEDGGYKRAEYWLSDAWAMIRDQGWEAPLYWEKDENGNWFNMTLAGMQPIDLNAPVCHVSLFEAQAYATWAQKRLPTEAEWEHAAENLPVEGNMLANGHYHPLGTTQQNGLNQMFGDVWEWTQSAYAPYPGFQPAKGALGEYNAKFMCSQFVLKGGSCVTPPGHIRATYRNFFYPKDRWQFSGIRLAETI